MMRLLAALALMALLPAAHAEPVKRVAIYVTPYYESGRAPGDAPRIAVASAYDALLASSRSADIVRARDDIAKNNALLTPMTLMVLAIRLYDVGLRDDAVFWFYAAKDRFFTLASVADIKSPKLARVEDAVRNFAVLAGPVINGYAFCDAANQQKIAAKALQWTIDNPYQAVFLPQVPALPGDRKQNLEKGIAELKAGAAKERTYLADPANAAKMKADRKTNGMDEKYCWKS